MRTSRSRRAFGSPLPRPLLLVLATVLAVFGLSTASGAAPATANASQVSAGARPDFRLPFACGQTWKLQTYLGHAPDDKKLDMYRVDGQTLGASVVASAAGTVTERFPPGGLEINHGGGWFSVYLHMDRIDVTVGQQVSSGTPLGRLGLVGTDSAHLHYEQLYDTNGDNDGETDEMVYPVIQNTEYRLSPSGPFPDVTSTNACGGNPPTPNRFWVDTFADAPGYAAVDCVGDTSPRCAVQGKLLNGTNYVLCKKKGAEVRVGNSYNHWWLLTDLDEVAPGGSGRAYVSAYYLQRWGNNEAKDNDGRDIDLC
ncbi:M23 family metallopeptidase [Streptomyces sp. NBC_01390]|uniref:M23 family metallopeptidase n=1 Tax=Streptomyces sp. NBC_01390 TaxID=2903850 RepID=UPI00324B87D8